MKFTFTFLLLILTGFGTYLSGQSVMELKEKKAEIEAAKAEVQAQVDAYQSELDGIKKELEILGGWKKGFTGLVGLNFGAQNNWASSANPNSSNSSLNLGFNIFANSIREKDFWRNKGIIALGWQSFDNNTNDDEEDGFLDDRTTDILNISSHYGRYLSDKVSISAQGELNSSVFNLFSPGTFDLGTGITWDASPQLTVLIHPLNYHVAFSSVDGVSSSSSIGAKVRADYAHTFPNGLGWNSTLTTFIPYVGSDEGKPTLFEYTWLNTLTYTVWKGIGVQVSFGLRNAEFESVDLQNYYNIGLSYSL